MTEAHPGSLNAAVGDRLLVRSERLGKPDRDGRIIEVRGPDGQPPYVVRWEDDGHVGLFFPGPSTFIEHYVHSSAAAEPR